MTTAIGKSTSGQGGSGISSVFSAFVALNLVTIISMDSAIITNAAKIPDVPDFFPEVKDDLSLVKWAHAVNSKAKLQEALNDSTMMIEADILMGTVEGFEGVVPIMAHPPVNISDLSAETFIHNVIHANLVHGLKKGIKLDFKQYEAVRPVLQYLSVNEDQLKFPVWLNADILQGPVNSSRVPIPGRQFLQECHNYFGSEITLSLGWTTKFGYDTFLGGLESNPKVIDEGEYTNDDIEKMLDFIENTDAPITFPVRAGIAAQSIDKMVNLLGLRPQATLTLWSPVDDPVNLEQLKRLIANIGKTKVYVDLPFDLENGPMKPSRTNSANARHDGLHHFDDTENRTNSANSMRATQLSILCIVLSLVLLNSLRSRFRH